MHVGLGELLRAMRSGQHRREIGMAKASGRAQIELSDSARDAQASAFASAPWRVGAALL